MGGTKGMDYADWAAEVDFVSNDHYVHPGPQARDELSFSANLTGNIAGGRPWFLMEHSTSAVNWQPVNVAKRAGRAGPRLADPRRARRRRGLLLPVAPVGGRRREVPLGDGAARRRRQRAVPGGGRPRRGRWRRSPRSPAPSASRPGRRSSSTGSPGGPASRTPTPPTGCATGRRRSTGTRPSSPWASGPTSSPPRPTSTGYDLVLRPVLHVVPRGAGRAAGRATCDGGGHLVTTYFSGVVDENDHVWLGGYPGALRDLLGIRIEEFGPLLDGEQRRAGQRRRPARCGPTGST